ncbi:hypothetical protein MLGJGCBP_05048 [Rhodococcus sp. T7]|nr:hypothetical protein MLGJGCBP_05048 [Rhodococcus sp. T7]
MAATWRLSMVASTYPHLRFSSALRIPLHAQMTSMRERISSADTILPTAAASGIGARIRKHSPVNRQQGAPTVERPFSRIESQRESPLPRFRSNPAPPVTMHSSDDGLVTVSRITCRAAWPPMSRRLPIGTSSSAVSASNSMMGPDELSLSRNFAATARTRDRNCAGDRANIIPGADPYWVPRGNSASSRSVPTCSVVVTTRAVAVASISSGEEQTGPATRPVSSA